jgi:hypothetical protein
MAITPVGQIYSYVVQHNSPKLKAGHAAAGRIADDRRVIAKTYRRADASMRVM